MNMKCIITITFFLLLSSGTAWTDDESVDEAESTIRLMGAAEAELPNAVTKEISLPAAATEDEAAVDKASKGLEKANERNERREKGLSQADEARERGAEMSEEAKENRENRGRSGDRPQPPEPPKGPPNN